MDEMQEEAKQIVLEYLSNAAELEVNSVSEYWHAEDAFVSSCGVRAARQMSSMLLPSDHSEMPPEILEGITHFNKNRLKKRTRTSPSKCRERLSKSMQVEIANFNRRRLRRLSGAIGGPEYVQQINNEVLHFDKSRLRKVQRRSFQKLAIMRSYTSDDSHEIPETPISNVTRRIEEISLCIMKENPCLLDNQIGELVAPLEIEEDISYELFASVARSVIQKQVIQFSKSIWPKVAIIVYLAKEVMFSRLMSDVQVGLLVDHASRFVAENVFDDIKRADGWIAFEHHHVLPDDVTTPKSGTKEQRSIRKWLAKSLPTKRAILLSSVTVSAIVAFFFVYIKRRM